MADAASKLVDLLLPGLWGGIGVFERTHGELSRASEDASVAWLRAWAPSHLDDFRTAFRPDLQAHLEEKLK